jgi:hypothetical protein
VRAFPKLQFAYCKKPNDGAEAGNQHGQLTLVQTMALLVGRSFYPLSSFATRDFTMKS